MAETTFTSVVWTAGDIITEAKLDNMTANDQAVDAHAQGIEFVERSDPSTPGANKIHLYAKDKSGVPTLYAINDAGTVYELSENRPTFIWTLPFVLYTGTNIPPVLLATRALTIVKAYLVVKTAPQNGSNSGTAILIDINKNGTSIWSGDQSNRLTLADNETTDSVTSFTTTSLVEDDQLTVDVDQVGDSTAGSQATVQLRCK